MTVDLKYLEELAAALLVSQRGSDAAAVHDAVSEIRRLRNIESAARAFFSQPYDNGQYEAALLASLRPSSASDDQQERREK